MAGMVIVDDNLAIGRGIISNIPWGDYQIDILGNFPDGRAALKKIRETHPDILLTDIVMPDMDGLELTHAVRQLCPATQVIVMSAYDQFDYVKEALRAGVFDYVMKPFDDQVLLETVLKALEEKRRADLLQERMRKSDSILRENFLSKLVAPEQKPANFWSQFSYLDLSFDCWQYVCILLRVDNHAQLREKLGQEGYDGRFALLKEQVKGALGQWKTWCFETAEHNLAVIVGARQVRAEREALNTWSRKIQTDAQNRFGFFLSFGIGNPVDTPEQIKYSYAQAQDALDARFFHRSGSVLFYEDLLQQDSDVEYCFPISIEERLIQRVCSGGREELGGLVGELAQAFRMGGSDKDSIRTFLCGTICKIMQKLYELEVPLPESFISQKRIFGEIRSFDDVNELFTWFGKTLENFCGLVEHNATNGRKHVITEVKCLIEQSYADAGLCLNEIAKTVGLSPTYLSGIFKKETGINISEYIFKTRMEKAKELLSGSSLKISTICARVGYANQFYFSTCFKKYSGYSPNDYRVHKGMSEESKQL